MKRHGCLAGLILLALFLCGCGGRPVTAGAFALDTYISVTGYGVDEDAVHGAVELCGQYERLLSPTVPDSEISRLNRGEVFPLSADTRVLLETALCWAEKTGGAFDPALGTVTSLWDFSGESAALPDDGALKAGLAAAGWEHIALSDDGCTLHGARLDPGGVAKGLIADRLAQAMDSAGAAGALVDLGGDVVCLGEKPGGEAFTVGVRDPFGEAGTMVCAVTLSDKAIVTSGVYERCFLLNGVRYHHILDPDTGLPAQSGLMSVTVICDSAADGDALATACMVLGQEAGMALIDSLADTWAIFITDSGELLFSAGLEDTFPILYP